MYFSALNSSPSGPATPFGLTSWPSDKIICERRFTSGLTGLQFSGVFRASESFIELSVQFSTDTETVSSFSTSLEPL